MRRSESSIKLINEI